VSETFYKSMQVRCEFDGVIRTVRVKCYCFDGSFAADTFFSVPANTRVKGRYVHGYVTSEGGLLEFRAHTSCQDRLS
jgi:hypothetical protein